MPTPNVYTAAWFSIFLGRIDADLVTREVAFLRRQLPAPGTRILDLCCGPGRHAAPLSAAGHRIIGLDRDAGALGNAIAYAPAARFVHADMRQIPLADASVDAVICMWQSFGHFEARANQHVLSELARVLVPNGPLIFDLYHRDFHAAHEGSRIIERDGERVHESRSMSGHRLRVRLRYEARDTEEEFDWQLYTPTDLGSMADEAGFRVRLVCSEFDERIPASAEGSRMQVVLDRS